MDTFEDEGALGKTNLGCTYFLSSMLLYASSRATRACVKDAIVYCLYGANWLHFDHNRQCGMSNVVKAKHSNLTRIINIQRNPFGSFPHWPTALVPKALRLSSDGPPQADQIRLSPRPAFSRFVFLNGFIEGQPRT